MSGLMELGHVRIPTPAKLYVGFDGIWACPDSTNSEIGGRFDGICPSGHVCSPKKVQLFVGFDVLRACLDST